MNTTWPLLQPTFKWKTKYYRDMFAVLNQTGSHLTLNILHWCRSLVSALTLVFVVSAGPASDPGDDVLHVHAAVHYSCQRCFEASQCTEKALLGPYPCSVKSSRTFVDSSSTPGVECLLWSPVASGPSNTGDTCSHNYHAMSSSGIIKQSDERPHQPQPTLIMMK